MSIQRCGGSEQRMQGGSMARAPFDRSHIRDVKPELIQLMTARLRQTIAACREAGRSAVPRAVKQRATKGIRTLLAQDAARKHLSHKS
jgi:hypothetical protein